jgi:hypothetical protein
MKKMEVYARYSKGEVWPNHAEKSSLFVWDSVLDTHQKKVWNCLKYPASPCTPWDGQYTSQPIWSLRILYQTLFGSNTHSLAGEVPVRPMRRMMRSTAFCFPKRVWDAEPGRHAVSVVFWDIAPVKGPVRIVQGSAKDSMKRLAMAPPEYCTTNWD